jgi:hypothetical protein
MAEDGEKLAPAVEGAGAGGEEEQEVVESVKLFVGQVPKHMTEAELAAMFQEVALVDEVTVIKDKATKASRGADPCARIWFLPPPFRFCARCRRRGFFPLLPRAKTFRTVPRFCGSPSSVLCGGFFRPQCRRRRRRPRRNRRVSGGGRIWTGLSFFYHARGRSRVEFYEYRGFELEFEFSWQICSNAAANFATLALCFSKVQFCPY